jgi:hypothetical protein
MHEGLEAKNRARWLAAVSCDFVDGQVLSASCLI